MSMVLYDLAGADPDVRFSPYCWRTRLALAHKGVPVDTVPWRFTDADVIAFSGQGKVPVLRDGGKTVSDSWVIAEYLEDQHPTPTLFGGSGGRAHALFINAWADAVLVGGIARFIVRDLLDIIDPKDRDYFRGSREARFGVTLEAVQNGRDGRLAAFRDLLLPIRLVLRRQSWLGGAAQAVMNCWRQATRWRNGRTACSTFTAGLGVAPNAPDGKEPALLRTGFDHPAGLGRPA